MGSGRLFPPPGRPDVVFDFGCWTLNVGEVKGGSLGRNPKAELRKTMVFLPIRVSDLGPQPGLNAQVGQSIADGVDDLHQPGMRFLQFPKRRNQVPPVRV